ncbi:MAG: YbcC family protein [Acidimicrobiia bacterium]
MTPEVTLTPAATVADALEAACGRIAPAWPLDRFVAVNPYWGWRALPIEEAGGRLGALGGTILTADRAWFRTELEAGRLTAEDLAAAASSLGEPDLARLALDVLCRAGDAPPSAPSATFGHDGAAARLPLVTDLADAVRAPLPGRRWGDQVTHQISQHCAAHADRWQAGWHPASGVGLYRSWLDQPSVRHTVRWAAGGAGLRAQLRALPRTPRQAIEELLDALGLPAAGREPYLTALLLSINGWASWAAQLRWEARLHGGDDDTIVELLAIRLAWESLVRADLEAGAAEGELDAARWEAWTAWWVDAGERAAAVADAQRVDWVLQCAAERAYQRHLLGRLGHGPVTVEPPAEPGAPPLPAVQAVFCIDVRSEVFRRALETHEPRIHTRGFAGFFGLPIAHTPAGTDLAVPHLPVLLAPGLRSVELPGGREGEASATAAVERARAADAGARRWMTVRHAPPSMFTFVETAGLLYGLELIRASVAGLHRRSTTDASVPHGLAGDVRPHLPVLDEQVEAAAELAARILSTMGLRDGFAPLVLLCGHGAETANNPHAAGLHCGACGGQRGDVNARALAELLNAPEVRSALVAHGIAVPHGTWFVAGLHNTTTDDVTLYDTDLVPDALRAELELLEEALAGAGDRARAERAPALEDGRPPREPASLRRAVRDRARDWSQTRPEWGLAGNAAFIVAPRARTRGVDLDGRVFLHDYDWRDDPDGAVLTTIMTAPMVVTNWINLQYHASTVDNRRYGSGNKVLHNVVGGKVGVFEGNGGDLRIGLALQSLHDGEVLRHPPLRLSVLIDSPRGPIDAVIDGHETVRQLVGNGWLHLLRFDDEGGGFERWSRCGWQPA